MDSFSSKIAIIGCGFVADYYVSTLKNYPELEIVGVYDIDDIRLGEFSNFHNLSVYSSFDDLLSDQSISIVLNLTNPRSHYEVSKKILLAGYHVYSEKPLAMDLSSAQELVSIAEENKLQISSAPCTLLSISAQSLWRAVRENVVGNTLAVYAELDDGLIHKMPYTKWKSVSGAPWPYKDEFEVGCTLEHAGYYVTWLVAFFGSVKSITSYANSLIHNKVPGKILDPADTPDFSIGILEFENGVVARLTTTIVAPHDHSIRIIGEEGCLVVEDCWDGDEKIKIKKPVTIRRKTFYPPFSKKYTLQNAPKEKFQDTGGNKINFAAGVYELASSIQEDRKSRLSSRFSLHINEIVLALQYEKGLYKTKTRADIVDPMNWAL